MLIPWPYHLWSSIFPTYSADSPLFANLFHTIQSLLKEISEHPHSLPITIITMPSTTFALFSAALALYAPSVAAITVPGGSDPTAGAVYTPDSTSTVTAGQPFNITWEPTTSGCGNTVALALLYGSSPSTMNALSYVISSTDNNGSYEWTPSTDLKPTDSDYKYGIELICESTQAYQYTSRFSLANSGFTDTTNNTSASSSASSSSPASTGSSTATGTPFPASNSTTSAGPTGASSSSSATASAGQGTSTETKPAVTTPTGSTSGASNPTGSPTHSSAAAGSTGSAGRVQAGLGGLVAAAAVVAAAL